jgi:hypothetical protein
MPSIYVVCGAVVIIIVIVIAILRGRKIENNLKNRVSQSDTQRVM